jgi:hypothetical protein
VGPDVVIFFYWQTFYQLLQIYAYISFQQNFKSVCPAITLITNGTKSTTTFINFKAVDGGL